MRDKIKEVGRGPDHEGPTGPWICISITTGRKPSEGFIRREMSSDS